MIDNVAPGEIRQKRDHFLEIQEDRQKLSPQKLEQRH